MSKQAQLQSSIVSDKSLAQRMAWQLVGVLGASVVLGFAFNAASPVGVRFTNADVEWDSIKLTTESSSSAVAPPTRRSVVLPPAPQPAENPTPRQVTLPATERQISTRRLTPATPVAPPLPTGPTVATSTSTNLTSEQNPSAIHWSQAKPLVEAGQAVLVDVRAKGMYDAGHIPGAMSLPEASSPEEFGAFLNQYPTNLTLILYCSSTSCSQSARVAGRLVTQFQRPAVKYMTGGYQEYQQMEAAKNASPPTK